MAWRKGQSGTVVQKGLMWHGRFYEDDGPDKRIRRSIPLGPCAGPNKITRPEAQRMLLGYLQEQGINSEARFNRVVCPGPMFGELAEWWEMNKLINQARSYRETRKGILKSHILPYFGAVPASAIAEKEAQEFVTHLVQKNLAPSTVKSVVACFRAILGEKATRDWSLSLPKPRNAEPRYFTPEESRRIINAASGQWRVLFALLAETGVRIGEAAGLHVEDIDLSACKVIVRRSVYRGVEGNTKTPRSMRAIYISPEVANMLKEHLAGRTTGRVFESRTGKPLDAGYIRLKLHSILKRLNIPDGTPHAFRHGRVSVLQANGVPETLIEKWVGHADRKMTAHYTHYEDKYQHELAGRLGILGASQDLGTATSVVVPLMVPNSSETLIRQGFST